MSNQPTPGSGCREESIAEKYSGAAGPATLPSRAYQRTALLPDSPTALRRGICSAALTESQGFALQPCSYIRGEILLPIRGDFSGALPLIPSWNLALSPATDPPSPSSK